MKPTWERGNVRLYLGDCREVLPHVGKVDACVTDPPYGMDWHFTGQGSGKNAQGGTESVTKGMRISGDSVAFDPSHLIHYRHVVIWGMHHFPQFLTKGTALVWIKKYPDAFGSFLSDADLAWMKGGCGVYCSEIINPASFQADKSHPTQKPVDLMTWCMDRSAIERGETVCDPYMGSGTTGVAAVQTGRAFVGVEICEQYFEIAVRRIDKAIDDGCLYSQTPPAIRSEKSLFGQLE